MKILLLGFGNVGRSLAEILIHPSDYPGLESLSVEVVGITTASRGSLSNRRGVRLEEALDDLSRTGRFSEYNPDFSEIDSIGAAQRLDYDVLVELTTLSIAGKGEPASTHIETALERRRHVVTANKGPLAFRFQDLTRLAERCRVRLLYESTVMDGAPVFNLARYCLSGCEIIRIDGVLNSTSHYVLSRLEKGLSIEEGVAEAQRQGFAEADPSHDLEGWDAAAKISILANRLMGAGLTPTAVQRSGFSSYDLARVRSAPERNCRTLPVARAWREESTVQASVGLEELPLEHPFHSVSAAGSMLRIETDLMGPLLIAQEGPSPTDTAYGVLNDLLEIARLAG